MGTFHSIETVPPVEVYWYRRAGAVDRWTVKEVVDLLQDGVSKQKTDSGWHFLDLAIGEDWAIAWNPLPEVNITTTAGAHTAACLTENIVSGANPVQAYHGHNYTAQ